MIVWKSSDMKVGYHEEKCEDVFGRIWGGDAIERSGILKVALTSRRSIDGVHSNVVKCSVRLLTI